jgi:choline dehydrogenase
MHRASRRDQRFDVIVVGGGSAGCVVAARLSEDRRRTVALIEAGPDFGPYADGRWPASLLDARVDGALAVLAGGTNEGYDWGFGGGISSSRAKVIGGCSSHNGCEVLRGSPADYDRWARETGDPSWAFDAFAPFLERAERAIRVRPSSGGNLSSIRRALLAAAGERGLPMLPELNAPDAVQGAGVIPVNAIGNVRWNAAFAYLDPARARPNLTILPDTLVDRLEVRDGRAHAVRTTTATLEADTIVLAAGTYSTPAILERSGIGDPDRLRPLGIRTAAALPGVGRNLVDHPYVLLHWRSRDRLRLADARRANDDRPLALSEIKWASPHADPQTWDTTIGAWSGTLHDQRAHAPGPHLAGLAPSAMGARSRGSVHIASDDPTRLPEIDHGLLTDPDDHDLDVLAAAAELCRDLAATAAWRHWCIDEVIPGRTVNGDALRAWLRETAAGTYHPCGTARMGPARAPDAVVDATGRVHGVDGLVVADASVFPSIPAANIHISVLAAAEKVAAALATRA